MTGDIDIARLKDQLALKHHPADERPMELLPKSTNAEHETLRI